MKFSYILDEAGWATATFADDGHYCKMRVSYLDDSLGLVADAAVSLLEGADSARFAFQDEPGEHRCVVIRTGEDRVRIRVLWYDDCLKGLPDEQGKEVFACDSSVTELCREVRHCLEGLLAEHGIERYKKLWISDNFPSEELQQIQELMKR